MKNVVYVIVVPLLLSTSSVFAGPWGGDWDIDSRGGGSGIPLWLSVPAFLIIAFFALRNSKKS